MPRTLCICARYREVHTSLGTSHLNKGYKPAETDEELYGLLPPKSRALTRYRFLGDLSDLPITSPKKAEGNEQKCPSSFSQSQRGPKVTGPSQRTAEAEAGRLGGWGEPPPRTFYPQRTACLQLSQPPGMLVRLKTISQLWTRICGPRGRQSGNNSSHERIHHPRYQAPIE